MIKKNVVLVYVSFLLKLIIFIVYELFVLHLTIKMYHCLTHC